VSIFLSFSLNKSIATVPPILKETPPIIVPKTVPKPGQKIVPKTAPTS
jgi:hypothetical protein